MKILGIVGSMRKEGRTAQLVEAVLAGAKEEDSSLKVEALHLADLEVGPCTACYDVCAKEPYKCVVKDDFQKIIRKMDDADGLVIGSPLYFTVPARLTALCERLACLAHFHDVRKHKGPHLLEDKPCGLVVATGGSDPTLVFLYLHRFALSLRLSPIYLKHYPYYGVAGKGDLQEDPDRPLHQAAALGERLAEAVKQ